MGSLIYKEQFDDLLKKIDEKKGESVLKEESSNVTALLDLSSTFKKRKTLAGHLGKIYASDWSSDSRKIVSASQDGKMLLWDALTGRKFCAVSLKSAWVMSCSYSPSGKFVASGGLDNLCSVFNVSESATVEHSVCELDGHDGCVSGCVFLSDNEILTCSGDHSSILWDVETKKKKTVFKGHVADVMDVSIIEDKSVFLSAGTDMTTKLWDMRTGKCTATFTGHKSDINSVEFMENGKIFGTGSEDATIRIGDIRWRGALSVLEVNDLESSVTSLSFSKSGRIVFASYEDSNIFLWDSLKEKRISVIDAHENRVCHLKVNKEGSALCTTSWDSTLKIWC